MKGKIVLFGASDLGLLAYDYLKQKYQILHFCDNDKDKINNYIQGIRVISVSLLLELLESQEIDIVISSHHYIEIGSQLIEMGINIDRIMVFNLTLQKLEKMQSLNAFVKKFEDIMVNNNVELNSNVFRAYNIHLMYDTAHTVNFIEYIYRNGKQRDNIVIITGFSGKYSLCDIRRYENVEYLDLNNSINYTKLYIYIYGCRKIYAHSLQDITCDILNRFSQVLKSKIVYWCLWGNDLYHYIDYFPYEKQTYNFIKNKKYYLNSKKKRSNIEKNNIRKSVIKDIDFVVTQIKGDYDLLRKHFETNAEHIDSLYSNIKFEELDEISNEKDRTIKEKHGYSRLLLLSNSSIFENNIIDIFIKIKELGLKDCGFILPISYGNSDYAKDILTEGIRLLGNSFITLDNFLEFQEYCRILNQVDAVVFNHRIQQAFGNIAISIYLGKILYLNRASTIYMMLKDLGVVGLYSIDEMHNDVGYQKLKQEDINLNRKIIKSIFEKSRKFI